MHKMKEYSCVLLLSGIFAIFSQGMWLDLLSLGLGLLKPSANFRLERENSLSRGQRAWYSFSLQALTSHFQGKAVMSSLSKQFIYVL